MTCCWVDGGESCTQACATGERAAMSESDLTEFLVWLAKAGVNLGAVQDLGLAKQVARMYLREYLTCAN